MTSMLFHGVIVALLGIRMTKAFESSWTVACFWTNTFNSSDGAIELCNHIIYEEPQVTLHDKTLTLKDDSDDSYKKKSGYKNVMKFRERHPQVKVELLIGQAQTKKVLYDIANNPEAFIKSSKDFLNNSGFDGIHLAWGSPAKDAHDYFLTSTKAMKQKKILTGFLKELKHANVSFSFGIHGVLEIDCNMEVEEVYALADLVFFYPYAYHGIWEETTGAYSPIYPGEEGSERVNSYYMTVDSTWESLEVWGGAPEKTVLVISARGNAFNLTDPAQHDINAPNDRRGVTRNTQPVFKEVCKWQLVQEEPSWAKSPANNWSLVWDDTRKQSYMYSGHVWLSYEDACSVIEKKKYAIEMKFAGMALKDLSRDDLKGDCLRRTLPDHGGQMDDNLEGAFPLLRIIAEKKEQSNPCKTPDGKWVVGSVILQDINVLFLFPIIPLTLRAPCSSLSNARSCTFAQIQIQVNNHQNHHRINHQNHQIG